MKAFHGHYVHRMILIVNANHDLYVCLTDGAACVHFHHSARLALAESSMAARNQSVSFSRCDEADFTLLWLTVMVPKQSRQMLQTYSLLAHWWPDHPTCCHRCHQCSAVELLCARRVSGWWCAETEVANVLQRSKWCVFFLRFALALFRQLQTLYLYSHTAVCHVWMLPNTTYNKKLYALSSSHNMK